MTSTSDGSSCEEANRRVLSIQSHVASGYVGNKAAVFPLQLLGFDVDVINSVQFSNHTGYPGGWEGEVLDGQQLGKLVDGMERNGLLSGDDSDTGRIGNILTGYIGSESFLSAVVNVVQKLKGLNPKCRYICDPVLGDMGRFYVPKELVDIYRRDVLPLADVITPNQFEVEQLTGISIKNIQDAQQACQILHDLGVSLVLITSIVFPDGDSGGGDCNEIIEDDTGTSEQKMTPSSNDSIGMFASRRQRNIQFMQQKTNLDQAPVQGDQKDEYKDEQYILYTPRLEGQFTGTGDVCAALFLGLTANNNNDTENGGSDLACSLEKLASTMHAIVQRTANAAAKKQTSSTSAAKRVSSRELQLINSRDNIIHPPRNFRAMRVSCSIDKS